MQITRKEMNHGVVVLELAGPLHSSVECTQLELQIDELLSENRKFVVLDFTSVSKVDSRGVGKIVDCFSRLKKAGGSLCLSGVHGMIGGVLQLTHVDRFLKIYPTTLEAAASFSGSPESSSL